ncbi:E3 ubiquitin-protein ligase TRIM33-like [Pecten maximus]|uniref:E3 ubiquitin-protein ligase TRIM33-like n=1 Tax=Pecten maximus TaxID=6579 RepID=UPI00145876B0|nr:E3 ubiquitin-protein ligase TRIM33-like [Pecten maximus]
MAQTATYSRTKGRHVRNNEQTTCRLHQKWQLEFYCRKCEDLCCNECLSTCHKAHSVYDIDEIIPEKKRDIQNFMDRTKKTDLVVVHDYITSTEKQLVDNASNFEKLASELETQTIKLKEELDLLSAQTLSIYSQMKEENTRLLQTYKQDLETYEEKIKQQLLESDTLLREGTHLEIFYLGCKTHYDEILPLKPTLQTATFTANVNYHASLKQALGDTSTGRGQSTDELDRWSTDQEDKRSTSPYSYVTALGY